MIISASRRTDIPALYSDWFINRLNAGCLFVKNPMNPVQVTKINLSPEYIDCIVFWTKNPKPLIHRLHEIIPYNYYFHYTLNPYDASIERNLPSKQVLIENFISLSQRIGSKRIIWRYDPVFYTPDCNYDFHLKSFEYLAGRLSGYTNRCMFSFLTPYLKCRRNMAAVEYIIPDEEQKFQLAFKFSEIARTAGIELQTCASSSDYSEYGISHGKCIDDELIREFSGNDIRLKKDYGQRADCRCVSSIDIGAYNTCTHGCIYCYANYNHNEALKNNTLHSSCSELLSGTLSGNEKITTKVKETPDDINPSQLKLF